MHSSSRRSNGSCTGFGVIGTVFDHEVGDNRRLAHQQPGRAVLRCGVMVLRVTNGRAPTKYSL